MALDRFKMQAWTSLAAYKREVLGVSEDGEWYKKKYPHILPAARRQLNILPAIRQDFWAWFRGRDIKLHANFHHLNSSQALCFNLFYPLLVGGCESLQILIDALGIAGAPGSGATFEFQPDESEGTCFDFMIPMSSGARLYFEVKYTETDFGQARVDAEHVAKFESVYMPRLMGRFEQPFCELNGFLGHYQIARNIWYLNAASADVAVFLYPKGNEPIRRYEPVIRTCALEPFRSAVRIVYLEDLLAALRHRSAGPGSVALTEFQCKYFPQEDQADNKLAYRRSLIPISGPTLL